MCTDGVEQYGIILKSHPNSYNLYQQLLQVSVTHSHHYLLIIHILFTTSAGRWDSKLFNSRTRTTQ